MERWNPRRDRALAGVGGAIAITAAVIGAGVVFSKWDRADHWPDITVQTAEPLDLYPNPETRSDNPIGNVPAGVMLAFCYYDSFGSGSNAIGIKRGQDVKAEVEGFVRVLPSAFDTSTSTRISNLPPCDTSKDLIGRSYGH
jgi:hypothetical protein